MNLKVKINSVISKIADKFGGNGVAQNENAAAGEKAIFLNMPKLTLKAAQEGTVLLKNSGVLPLKEKKVSVFGRCQLDYFYVGYGSGGDVHVPYFVNAIEGFRSRGIRINEELFQIYENWCKKNPVDHGFWGHWPMCYPEMKLSSDIVKDAAKNSDTAVVIIGRAAGEDRENKLEKGSYYLTDTEFDMLEKVTSCFDSVTVVMNCGNIIDMSWILKFGDKIGAVVYAWQCGMESGNALADILSGKVSPSGKLADTIAIDYKDYPSSDNFGNHEYNNYAEDIFVGYRYFETFSSKRVLYPFGFGLSYTSFEIREESYKFDSNRFTFEVSVKNVGNVSGKETVQIYVDAPDGKLLKARKSLVAFAKTKLLKPNQEEKLKLSFDLYSISSFDEEINSYVTEEGIYEFYIGNSVDSASFRKKEKIKYTVVQSLQPICPVKEPFTLVTGEQARAKSIDLRQRIIDNLPEEIGYKGNRGYKLSDVKSGKITLNEFIEQLNNEELEALSRGEGGMNSKLGVSGNAGAFGGIIPSLRAKGVPPVITTDGPAGIRIKSYTSLIPCGTALACTWNEAVVQELADNLGKELRLNRSDVLLAPGMNIHRNVLCGRNFEYFSEDPLLSGKMAAAYVRGIQNSGLSACPKHFACNNQEVCRTTNDSRITQRALREIYLKGFEICIKESKPLNIMTSYNKINGVWSHYNYDLVTTVLRGEWGYEGNVMTDWWMQKSASPEFPSITDHAYRVRAQVDVYMPGSFKRTAKKYKSDGSLLRTLGRRDGITRGELERTAVNVLNLILRLKIK